MTSSRDFSHFLWILGQNYATVCCWYDSFLQASYNTLHFAKNFSMEKKLTGQSLYAFNSYVLCKTCAWQLVWGRLRLAGTASALPTGTSGTSAGSRRRTGSDSRPTPASPSSTRESSSMWNSVDFLDLSYICCKVKCSDLKFPKRKKNKARERKCKIWNQRQIKKSRLLRSIYLLAAVGWKAFNKYFVVLSR